MHRKALLYVIVKYYWNASLPIVYKCVFDLDTPFKLPLTTKLITEMSFLTSYYLYFMYHTWLLFEHKNADFKMAGGGHLGFMPTKAIIS